MQEFIHRDPVPVMAEIKEGSDGKRIKTSNHGSRR